MLSLEKKPEDMNPTEVNLLLTHRLIEVTDVIRSFVNEYKALSAKVDSFNEKLNEMDVRFNTQVTFIKNQKIPTMSLPFKYGQQRIVVVFENNLNNEGEGIRFLYSIDSDGSCLAWRKGKTSDPPSDGDITRWLPKQWKLISNT